MEDWIPVGDPASPGASLDNNVGNIRQSNAGWLGKGAPQNGFETFETPEDGVAAAVKNLQHYGPIPLSQAIAKWAPAADKNDPAGYTRRVASETGLDPTQPIPFDDPHRMASLVKSMTGVEKGRVRFGDDVFYRGVAKALGPLDDWAPVGQSDDWTPVGHPTPPAEEKPAKQGAFSLAAQTTFAANPVTAPLAYFGPGMLEAGKQGLIQSFRDLAQTGQTLMGKKPEGEAPTLPASQPVEWGDLLKPGSLLEKSAYGFARSFPTIAAGIAGGALGGLAGGEEAGVGALVGAPLGAGVGAAMVGAMQALGPSYAAELKKTPNDADGAFDRAVKSASEEGAISGISFAAFEVKPFGNIVRDLLKQSFGIKPAITAIGEQALVVQPAVTAAGTAATNVIEGRSPEEGVAASIPGAVIGTALPAAAFGALHGFPSGERARSTPRAEPAPEGMPEQTIPETPAAPQYRPLVQDDGTVAVGGPDGELPERYPTYAEAKAAAERLNGAVTEPSKPTAEGPLGPEPPPAEPEPRQEAEPSSTSEPPAEGIPFMVTRAMQEQLRALGYSDDDIRTMTPAQANETIRAGERAPERAEPESPAAAIDRMVDLAAEREAEERGEKVSGDPTSSFTELAQRETAAAEAERDTALATAARVTGEPFDLDAEADQAAALAAQERAREIQQQRERKAADKAAKRAEREQQRALKSARRPADLLEFLSRSGGVQDPGGELRGLDAHLWHLEKRSRRKLVNDKGMTPEEAQEKAEEAGYQLTPPGEESDPPNDLFDAIDRSMSGKPVFSEYDRAELETWKQARNYYDGAYENDLSRRAEELGIPTTGNESVPELEKLIYTATDALRNLPPEALADEMDRALDLTMSGEDLPFFEEEPNGRPGEAAAERGEAAAPAPPAGEPANPAPAQGGAEPDPGGESRSPAAAARAPAIETTEQGEQRVIPGTERSAKQAAQAREAEGRGKLTPEAAQKPADEGLFAPKEDPGPESPGLSEGTEGPPGAPGVAENLREDFDRFAPDASRSPDHLNQAAAAFVRNFGVRVGNEALVATTPHGEMPVLTAYTVNLPDRVGFSPDLLRWLELPDTGAILHHNHPSNGALSQADVAALTHPGLSWVIAHGHDGELSGARLSDRAFAALASLPTDLRHAAIAAVYRKVGKTVDAVIREAFVRGRISAEAANYLYGETINRVLDAAGLTDYIGTRELPAEIDMTRHAELPQAAFDRGFAVAHGDLREMGIAPKEQSSVRPDRPAGTLRPADALARIFAIARSDAAEGRSADKGGDRGGAGAHQAAREGLAEDEKPFEELPKDAPLRARGEPVAGGDRSTPPPEGRDPVDNVSQQQAEAVAGQGGDAGKGAGTYERSAREMAQRQAGEAKNLNLIEPWSIFPATLGALDPRFARLYNAVVEKGRTANRHMEDLRGYLKVARELPAEELPGVYAALELARKWSHRFKDDGSLIRVKNTSYKEAVWSTVGDDYLLNPRQTQAVHEFARLGDRQWDIIMDAAAKGMGWKGPRDIDAILAAARKPGAAKRNLTQLATTLAMLESQKQTTYFPAMRFGDQFIAVKAKQGKAEETKDSLGGFPPVVYFQTAERSPWRDILGMPRAGGIGREHQQMIDALNKRNLYGEFKLVSDRLGDRYESPTHVIETGDLHRRPEVLRNLNIPAIEKLMMLLENGSKREFIRKQNEMIPPGLSARDTKAAKREIAQYDANGRLIGGSAFEEYGRLTGDMLDALRTELYANLRAGFRRKAELVPGYDPDFSRAVGTHMYQIAHHAAEIEHRNTIERAHLELQDNHPHAAVRKYAQKWMDYQSEPPSLLGRFANSATRLGFTYALAMNPSSTFIIAAHTPMAALPIMSAGVGMAPASAHMGRALAEVYRQLGFDSKQGAHINIDKLGRTPQERAFIKQLADDGLLHSLGADDLQRLTEGAAAQYEVGKQVMRRAFEIAGSNVRAVDQANRAAIALATFRMAQRPDIMAKWHAVWDQNNWRYHDLLQRNDGKMTPELMGRFMLDQAGMEWGRQNRPQMMRGGLGTLLFTLHGFQARYLSNALRLMKNMGPEGKTAALWMMGALAMGAGFQGLPFTQDLENAGDLFIKHFFKEHDPMLAYRLQAALVPAFGKTGAEIAMRGPLGYLAGIDLTGRVGFGDVLSREVGGVLGGQGSPAQILGAVPGILWNHYSNAKLRLEQGKPLAAFGELLPSAGRNVVRAEEEAKHGIVSRTGHTLLPASKLSASDLLKQGIGFTPRSVEEMYQNREYHYRAQHAKGSTPPNPVPAP